MKGEWLAGRKPCQLFMGKPEQIKGCNSICKKGIYAHWMKKFTSRFRRRKGKQDPENAPTKVTKGWIW